MEFLEFDGIQDGIERKIFVRPDAIKGIIAIGENSSVVYADGIPFFGVQETPESIIKMIKKKEKTNAI